MKFSLLVIGDPVATPACRLALRFARAALAEGHDIYRVFFFSDAARIASRCLQTDLELAGTSRAWEEFADSTGAELLTCVSSAYRRGILDEQEAAAQQVPATLAPSFEIAGLGQLAEAVLTSDRVMTFGR